MDYFTLGKTGLKVSRLALGTMTFGDDWGWGADEKNSRALFDMFMQAGGNFIDTADLYTGGNSEKLLGKFIKETGTRDNVVLTTKFSYNTEPGNVNAGGNGRKNIIRALEGSLKRLDTDYIDLYMLHTWDKVTPAEEVIRTFDDLVRSGKVRHVGISDAPAWYIAQLQTLATERGLEPLATAQLEYSLVERNIEHEFVPMAQRLGTSLMAWSPLASGLLSGKYKPSNNEVKGEGRLATVAGSGNPAFEKFSDRNFKIVAELERVADHLGRSMAQVALNWVANQPGVSSVLIGATKVTQLQDNLSSLDFEIPKDLMEGLNKASAPEVKNPYSFFTPAIQGMIHGGASVGDKPSSYYQQTLIQGEGAGVTADAD
ncbi:aldo/keto reductase [Aliiglaciecola sp. M165]|uniref:aldo/keto reductase n=1 Tax=Aliiglaciecola sp. M165 TaxID=2593649 RepID=UPI00117CDEC8|nr:aldo/keto reductase [Aliiglaciecola sp. M165]TRY33203.1 aldo/keto reductase [Aliiglaciecola sp. M165]